jgi:demethylmenaquinone methyltransferase/2-methoxy-6-polyprenyl-1,4-benzoquinol methylase
MIAVRSKGDAFASVAPTFDRHRALPDGVPEAIRTAVLAAVDASPPRLLDLGAGTGRIGIPFIAARDDYVGVDLSFGMLSEFKRRAAERARAPHLLQADGERLPFADASFDAIMLIQVFGGMRGWRRVLTEVRRVLRGAGVLVLGRAVAPPDGLDARMKAQLALLLDEIGAPADRPNTRQDAQGWLEHEARGTRLVAATWTASRTPRGFIDRHRTGARFSALPTPVKDEAMRRLASWAATAFGSLDAASAERNEFELQLFRFS